MRIVHPQQPVNGLNPEDVFYAVDDLGTQTGYGFILYQLQPGLYPDCPVNLYFSIDGDAASRYLLFGALVARARVLPFIESGSSNALCRGHAQITGAASIKENVTQIVSISSNLPASVVIGHLEHAMDAKLTHPVGSTNTITILLMQNMNIV